MKRALACTFLLLAVASLLAADKPKGPARRYLNVPDHFADLPFTDAVLAGDTLYISGRLGIEPKTRKAPDKIEDEVRLLMDSVKTALAQADMTMDDVVSVQVFCPDLSLYGRFNAEYKTYFPGGRYPARAFIGSGPLLFGAHFEVVAVAVRK